MSRFEVYESSYHMLQNELLYKRQGINNVRLACFECRERIKKLENRKFARVKAHKINPSSILPVRFHDNSVAESVKVVGIQQPLIVRPSPSCPGKYEIIDGGDRYETLDPEQIAYVDLRENATDLDVFKISEATSKRTQRSTYENAAFYAAYVGAVKKEAGEKGALARVAAETQISQSELSQYLSINKLFLKLDELDPESRFRKLKEMGINKLYELSELIDNPKLLDVARQIEEKADSLTLEGISTIVNDQLDNNPEELLETLFGDDESSKCPSHVFKEDDSFTARFREVLEKVLKIKEDLNASLQNVEMEKLPTTESTLNVLEKMLVSLRRLAYYSNKLSQVPGKPSEK